MVFTILNEILRSINYGIEQVRSNSWYIFLLIISIYIVKNQFKKLSYRASGVTLGTSTSNGNDRNAISKARTKREEEMHQARLRQQEILNQKAKDALEQKRELLKKKPLLDNDSSSKPDATNGDSNQTNSTTTKKYTTKPSSQSKTIPSSGYNPMQPWSASTAGGTYRPSRRANPRGGG